MNLEMRIKLLETAYNGALVDSIYNYDKNGILDQVTEDKKQVQFLMGPKYVENFVMKKAEDVFLVLKEGFNCADWVIEEKEEGFEAVAKGCKLCGLAKEVKTKKPCDMYCLNPMAGMIKAIDAKLTFNVKETLWHGQVCKIEVK